MVAGAHRVAALRAARAASARALGHEVVAIDVGPELLAQLLEAKPDAAFIALHGGDGEDGTVQGLLEAIGIPYTGSGPAACMRSTDKALAKHLMREARIPTPDLSAFKESAIKDLGVAAALPDVEQSSGFRWSSSPRVKARRWASSSRTRTRSCRPRSWEPCHMTARSCSSAT